MFAACGGSDSGSSDESPQKPCSKGSTFEGIESADLDLSVNVDVSGDEGGNVDVSLSGPFQSKGEGQLPELDLTAEASGSVGGKDVDFDGGIVLVPNKAYVSYEGEDYEVDPTTFSFVQSAIEEAQRKSGAEGGTEGATDCQEEAAGEFKRRRLRRKPDQRRLAPTSAAPRRPRSAATSTSAGRSTRSPKLTELPACSSQLEAAGPLPLGELEEAKGEIEKALKSAHADVYVGDDNIIRRFTAEFDIAARRARAKRSKIELDLALNGVNEEQEISTPDGAKPLNDLFQKLGINPIELLQGAQSGAGLGGLLEQLGGSSGTELPGIGGGGRRRRRQPRANTSNACRARRPRSTCRTAPRSSSSTAMEGGGTPRLNAAFLRSPYGWPYLLVPLIPAAVALDLADAAGRRSSSPRRRSGSSPPRR